MIEGLPKAIGDRARRIMETALTEHQFRCESQSDRITSRNLNARQLLRRDPKEAWLWYPTDKAYELTGRERPVIGVDLVNHSDETLAVHAANHTQAQDIVPIGIDGGGIDVAWTSPPCEHFTVPPAVPAVSESSDLVAAIESARAMLDAGDVQAALLLSGGLYERAKAGAAYAQKVKASRELIDKARRMQAEALKIESMCYVAMADAIDEAQSSGRIARKGRPKNVSDENIFTMEEVGVDRQQLHQARKLRDAVRAEPNFVERVVEARLDAGLEPSRRSISHAIGTRSASNDEKGDQLYETPQEATKTLLALESFSSTVMEPAVGRGAILRVLEAAGYDVAISDLRDRGVATQHGELQQVGDFLKSTPGDADGMDIVTNPPYGDVANAFLAHALRAHRPGKMAALLNLNFMCGFDDPGRRYIMDETPPSRVYVFTRRLPMMHRDGWDGPKATSQMNTAWFVWERNDDGSYGRGAGRFETIRVDWQAHQDVPALAPGDGGYSAPLMFAADDDDEDFTRETPRKTLDERCGEERDRAIVWMAGREAFDAVTLRRGIGVRPSVADALIAGLSAEGLIAPDGEGWRASQTFSPMETCNEA